MKWILKRCLLVAPAIIFYSLFSFNVCLVSGCGSTDSSGPGGGPRISGTSSSGLRLSAYGSTDSSGPGGSPKVLSFQTSGKIPAGSVVVLKCTSKDCILRLSTDTTAHPGGVKRLILGTIPVEIPDNTELVLQVIPRGDPALTDSAAMVK